jgi:hypothetical protein
VPSADSSVIALCTLEIGMRSVICAEPMPTDGASYWSEAMLPPCESAIR